MVEHSARRADVVRRLQEMEDELRCLGAARIYLFGSVARDEGRPDSDIDLFVDPDPSRRFGFDEFMDVFERLQATFGARASVTTREGLHHRLRAAIERDAMQVF